MKPFKKPQLNSAPSVPIQKKFLRWIFNFIKYPFKIADQYSGHQKGVGKIIEIVKYQPKSQNYINLQGYIKKDSWAKNTYIFLPLFLATLSYGAFAYKNKKNYIDYYTLMTIPVTETRWTGKVSLYVKKVYFAIRYIPVSKDEFIVFAFFYGLAVLGARFASNHPALKIQEGIQTKLLDDGKVDQFGRPWLVVWTREAILVKTYGTNEESLTKDASFWTDINFPRTPAKSETQKDMQIMVFVRKQELNRKMEYDFKNFIDSQARAKIEKNQKLQEAKAKRATAAVKKPKKDTNDE